MLLKKRLIYQTISDQTLIWLLPFSIYITQVSILLYKEKLYLWILTYSIFFKSWWFFDIICNAISSKTTIILKYIYRFFIDLAGQKIWENNSFCLDLLLEIWRPLLYNKLINRQNGSDMTYVGDLFISFLTSFSMLFTIFNLLTTCQSLYKRRQRDFDPKQKKDG